MNYSIEGGTLPVLICKLDAGESIISEAGGRTWMKGNITTENKAEGGIKKGLGRMLSGESLFMSRYTANGPCEIAFASSFPGTIVATELAKGETIICQKKAFKASTESVELSMHFQKKLGKGLFGGEGFIMQKVTGPGIVFLEFDGHCVEYNLASGEKLICDTGVVAAMEETCGFEIESIKGIKNIVFGGEGLFETVVTGPGKVWVQSMTIEQLASLIVPYVPSK
ncbi:MAG: TIGR00266 family protein [Anaerotignaceae bacterium]